MKSTRCDKNNFHSKSLSLTLTTNSQIYAAIEKRFSLATGKRVKESQALRVVQMGKERNCRKDTDDFVCWFHIVGNKI